MKKFASSVLIFVFGSALFAQNIQINKNDFPPVRNVVKNNKVNLSVNPRSTKGTSYFINYSKTNQCDAGYMWSVNTRYVLKDTGVARLTLINEVGVSFKDFIDTNLTPFTPTYPIRIDTLYILMSHENNSGENDSIMVYIQKTNTTGTPTGTVVWKDTTITNSTLSPGGRWIGNNSLYVLTLNPNVTITTGKFFVGIKYYGNKTDTFGISASFQNVGDANNPMAIEATYGKSYRKYPYPNLNNGAWLPNPSGSDIYFDRNSNGKYDLGTNEAHYLQCINIMASITGGVGINENKLKNVNQIKNYPNPVKQGEDMTISLNIANADASASMSIYNSIGQKINEYSLSGITGVHNTIVNTQEMHSGLYFYTVKTSEGSITKSFAVQ